MATATLQQTQIIVSDSSNKETRKSPLARVDSEKQFASLIRADKKHHATTRTSLGQEKQEAAKEITEEMPLVNGDELSFEHAVSDGLVEDQGQDQDMIEELVQIPQFSLILPPSPQSAQGEAVKLDIEDGQVQVEDVNQEIGVAAVGLAVPQQPAEEVLVPVVDSVLPVQNLPKENQIKVSNDNNPNSQVIAQQDGQFTLSAETVEPPVNLSQIDNDATKRPVVVDAGVDKTASSALQREEMPLLVKTAVDVVGKEDITKHDISGSVKVQKQSAAMPELITVSANLVLADETRHGKSVIAKLDTAAAEGLDPVISEPVSIPVVAKKLASDNNNSGDSDILSQDDLLMISSGITSSTGNEFTKELGITERSVREQVTSSIREMLVAQDNGGKKEITINLFPEKLGAVKVEIISVLGEDGARKVESIKFTAEKRETLEILERSRLELEKTLKEVNSTNEETSLEFEMNRDGQNGQAGAYFDSLKERDNWMNSFLTFNDIDNEVMQGQVSDDHSRSVGHITEDSVDIRI